MVKDFPTLTDDLIAELQWIYDKQEGELSGIKQQKFLLFYNLFAACRQQHHNFESLKAWTNGPVYTQVHSAVKHHYSYQELFDSCSGVTIDEEIAHVTKFIIELLSDEEISEVTHQFDFWKDVMDRTDRTITENDISIADLKKIKKILNLYSLDFIMNHTIIATEKSKLIVRNDEYDFIKNKLYRDLEKIESKKPVKIKLDAELLKVKEQYDLYGEINKFN